MFFEIEAVERAGGGFIVGMGVWRRGAEYLGEGVEDGGLGLDGWEEK